MTDADPRAVLDAEAMAAIARLVNDTGPLPDRVCEDLASGWRRMKRSRQLQVVTDATTWVAAPSAYGINLVLPRLPRLIPGAEAELQLIHDAVYAGFGLFAADLAPHITGIAMTPRPADLRELITDATPFVSPSDTTYWLPGWLVPDQALDRI